MRPRDAARKLAARCKAKPHALVACGPRTPSETSPRAPRASALSCTIRTSPRADAPGPTTTGRLWAGPGDPRLRARAGGGRRALSAVPYRSTGEEGATHSRSRSESHSAAHRPICPRACAPGPTTTGRLWARPGDPRLRARAGGGRRALSAVPYPPEPRPFRRRADEKGRWLSHHRPEGERSFHRASRVLRRSQSAAPLDGTHLRNRLSPIAGSKIALPPLTGSDTPVFFSVHRAPLRRQ